MSASIFIDRSVNGASDGLQKILQYKGLLQDYDYQDKNELRG